MHIYMLDGKDNLGGETSLVAEGDEASNGKPKNLATLQPFSILENSHEA